MTKFVRKGKIPSCFVTKSLLADVESYLNVEMRQKLGEKLGDKISYKISIKEKIGTETLGSVSEYSASRFSDGTKEIEIDWHNGYESDVRLNIHIGLDGGFISLGELRIDCTSPMARETAIGVGDAILRLLNCHRTYNWIFNPTPEFPIVSPAAIGVAAVLIAFGISKINFGGAAPASYFVCAVLAGWVFVSATFFRPRVSFDTRRRQLLDRIWVYFSLGTFGFVVFGTLLPLVRNTVLGF